MPEFRVSIGFCEIIYQVVTLILLGSVTLSFAQDLSVIESLLDCGVSECHGQHMTRQSLMTIDRNLASKACLVKPRR